MQQTQTSKPLLGKRNRAAGKRFELKVRKDLEDSGWVVCKWTNTIDFENDKLIQAKSKYNPFLKRVISEGSGFPDYVAFKLVDNNILDKIYVIIGVEAKKAKYLDKPEKKMVQWLRQHNIFSKIFIAYLKKEKNKLNIDYYVP